METSLYSAAKELQIAGLIPLSSVDWPDKLVASVFCQGCPWRCRYCHNHDILSMRTPGKVQFKQLLDLLERRKRLLDGVVFSGGEALAQSAVIPAIKIVKELGYQVGLHNAGAFPKRLEELLQANLLDWVGQDIKASPQYYPEVTGVAVGGKKAWSCVKMLVEAKIDFEVRLSVYPGYPDKPVAIAKQLQALGVKKFALQNVRLQGILDPSIAQAPGQGEKWKDQIQDWAQQIEKIAFNKFSLRSF